MRILERVQPLLPHLNFEIFFGFSVTVSELSDYITWRKKNQKSQYLNEVQN